MKTIEEIKNQILQDNLDVHSSEYSNNRLTMAPRKTLENVEFCIRECVKNKIEGDFIECGVWRGGISIFVNEIFKSLNENRKVYLSDSFEGLPKPNPEKYPMDSGDIHWTLPELSVSLESVKENFKIFGDINDNIIFLKGWFKDTLPTCEIEKICILRMDGDMYESTIDTLVNLYPKLSIGGFCIVDDYGHKGANKAVHDYRDEHNITDEIIIIDPRPGVYPSAYWIKTK
jgi:O-methyltransferase